MCKIVLGSENYPIKINGTKVHIPLSTRKKLIIFTAQGRNNANKIYHNSLLTGKIGRTDAFGGLTIPKSDWKEMTHWLNLILINETIDEKINALPAIAS